MAFPVVATSSSQGGTTAASPGVSVTLPSGIAAGDLLIAFVAGDTDTTFTASGWTEITAQANGANCQLTILAKIAAGSDTMTLVGEANDYAIAVARITGHDVSNVANIPKGTPATGSDAAPDPPSLTPPSTKDWLFLECFGADDDDDTATYWSTNYTGIVQQQSANSNSSCLVAVAYRELNTGSAEDPGVMAMAAAEEWVAQTLAIPPKIELDAATGAYSVTGSDVLFKRGYVMPAETGAYSVTGSAADITQTPPHKGELYLGNSIDGVTKVAETTSLGGDSPGYDEWGIFHEVISESPTVVSSTSEYIRVGFGSSGAGGDKYYSLIGMVLEAPNAPWSLENKLSAATGSYTVTGSPVTFKRSLVLPCVTGSYSVSGQPAAFKRGYQLDLDAGSFTVTGSPVAFKRNEVLAAEIGNYAVTGQPALLKRALRLPLETGSFTVTGSPVATKRGLVMPLEIGSYAVTGVAATLTQQGGTNVTMPAAVGSFLVTGQPILFQRSLKMQLATGAFAVSGQPLATKRGYKLPCATGSYAVTGQAAALKRSYRMPTVTGSYAVDGQAAALKVQRMLKAETGSYTVSGFNAELDKKIVMPANTGSYNVAGQQAFLKAHRRLAAATGAYSISGQSAALASGRRLEASTGSYVVSGVAPNLVYNGTRTRRVIIVG